MWPCIQEGGRSGVHAKAGRHANVGRSVCGCFCSGKEGRVWVFLQVLCGGVSVGVWVGVPTGVCGRGCGRMMAWVWKDDGVCAQAGHNR